MKPLILIASLIGLGTTTAMAAGNPASIFCEEIGGTSEIATLSDGSELGLCVFDNGNTFEEWTLFRLLASDKE